MITTAILYILYLFISGIVAILPVASLPSDITTAISTASSYISSFDFIFPVSTFLAVFSLILILESAFLIYKIIMWIIKKIPTIS